MEKEIITMKIRGTWGRVARYYNDQTSKNDPTGDSK